MSQECMTVREFLFYSQVSWVVSMLLFAIVSVPLAMLASRSAWLRRWVRRDRDEENPS